VELIEARDADNIAELEKLAQIIGKTTEQMGVPGFPGER
jgi:hypothetical protein